MRKYQPGRGYNVVVTRVDASSEDNWRAEYHFDQRGLLHRDPDEGPAVRIFDGNGDLWEVEYVWHGWRHRDDGPALIRYEPGNHPCLEEWYRYGWIHRRDGPAHIERIHGVPLGLETFFLHGYKFRDSRAGPQIIEYDFDGTVTYTDSADDIPPRPQPSRKWLRQTFGFVPPGRPR